MNVELIVDSTVDVPEHIRSRLTVVPLTIHFGQEEYLDGVTMDKHRFYERLVESDVLPTTSQASPAAFDREFRRVRCSGGSAVVLTIAAGLSGTYQSACIAAAEYDNIYVVDSGTAAIGAGILAEYALACLDRGMDAAGLARGPGAEAAGRVRPGPGGHPGVPEAGRPHLQNHRPGRRIAEHQAGADH